MTRDTSIFPTVRFTLNGHPAQVAAPGGRRLLDVLRSDLGLPGTKEGCGEGECGACSVLLDGVLVNSCLVPVCQVEGRAVTTVEGLAGDGRLDPIQDAFLQDGAVQCGFCTPGILLAGRAFLDNGAPPTEPAIREAIAGNICRCTGYTRIVEAIATAAEGGPAADASVRPRPAPAAVSEPVGARAAGTAPGPVPVLAPLGPTGAPTRDGPPSVTPRTLREALEILADGVCRPIAGGTDVMVGLANGAGDGRPLLDLASLDELRGIHLADEPQGGSVLLLGALTTYAELRRSSLVAEHLPVLAEAAATVGAAQIQARGTLGGNVVNASPAGDMLPILLATDASIVLGSVRGERRVPTARFFTGYRTTARAADELLVRIEIPLPPGRRVRFRKVGTRRAQAIAKVVMAVSWADGDGAWRDVRVALGSVAPVPLRVPGTEAILEGEVPTPAVADRAAAAVAVEIHPIDDVRSTAAYRRLVAGRALRRIILDAAAAD